ncbi:hypothetical protein JK361_13560 [Streptomyces sp. 5-8]|uniref:Uncharacterized protein n=1 Tax=Streptomyces musisoli TaxID=2802280 RepID=A0ABS1P024_9ACTN|nr:hypothetical protein [Streptomyces musisoli]MBL1105599.1 hypothetical protein [Streptomyces musisoli]
MRVPTRHVAADLAKTPRTTGRDAPGLDARTLARALGLGRDVRRHSRTAPADGLPESLPDDSPTTRSQPAATLSATCGDCGKLR